MATPFKVKIYVSEIANVLTQFDQMQVQRSKVGSPYADAELITAAAAAAAELISANEGQYIIGGQDLFIEVDFGLEQTFTFILSPATILDVVTEFNSNISGATASDDGTGKMKIESNTTGTGSKIVLPSGSALVTLGFTAGDEDAGEDANIDLVTDQTEYEYDDNDGDATYWYRTRYYNSVTGAFSSWSDWVQGDTGSAVTSANLIVGYVKLADTDGTALAEQKVVICNLFLPDKQDGYAVLGGSKEIETDATGRAELTLVKGSVIDVIITGTSIVRRVDVPTTGTEFDMLDDAYSEDDPFSIQVPDLPAAVRRT